MGMTRSHYPDEVNTSDEVNLDDKRVITDEEKKLFTFCGLHDTSLMTTEPGGQLMGMTKSHYPDEINASDEVKLDDQRVITDEVKKIIQWRQQVTWTVTKPAKQTVGAQ